MEQVTRAIVAKENRSIGSIQGEADHGRSQGARELRKPKEGQGIPRANGWHAVSEARNALKALLHNVVNGEKMIGKFGVIRWWLGYGQCSFC